MKKSNQKFAYMQHFSYFYIVMKITVNMKGFRLKLEASPKTIRRLIRWIIF